MSGVLSGYEPREVLAFFEQLTAIPHGSRNTGAISDFLVSFARERGLAWRQDEAGNVVIRKPASAGYEAAPTVMIQGHMDMVAAKAEGSAHDFARDPLQLRVIGDRVYATDTTLGGDDGIAVAYALALLTDAEAEHPALECVFTVDEEEGMDGALALDPSDLKAEYLINIDSEEEGIFTVSCAGGNRCNLSLPFVREEQSGMAGTLCLTGLLGGHSGVDIDKGRLNAAKGMAEALTRLKRKAAFYAAELTAGAADNVIPSAAKAKLLVPASSVDAFVKAAAEAEAEMKREWKDREPGFSLSWKPDGESSLSCISPADLDRLLAFLNDLPNGVQAMSRDLEGLVQTSLNLGILRTEGAVLKVSFSVRSSVEEEKLAVCRRLREQTKAQPGAEFEQTKGYSGWAYEPVSPFRDLAVETFRDLYGRDPETEAIHAGLECGIFKAKMPNLQILALGPDLYDIHSPQESFSLASVERVWQYLRELLRRIH